MNAWVFCESGVESKRELTMVMHVTATVRNPAEPERSWEGLFLVDTGATDCLVPGQHLEAIGLEAKGERVYGLADGERASDVGDGWSHRNHGGGCGCDDRDG